MSRRRSTTVSLAVATLAGGLLLTACGGGSGKDSTSAAGTPSAGAQTPNGSTSAGSDGSTAEDTTAGGSTGGAAADTTTSSGTNASGLPGKGAGSGGAACHTADLSFGYGPDSGAQQAGSAGAVIVKMTNKGSAACSMKGYPGVDLSGADGTWSLVRQTSVAPQQVTVQPGSSTSFTITYMPYLKGSGEQFDVKDIVITPPNETHSAKLAWDFQPVLRQDGATHPATFVGPVGGK